MKNSDNKKNTLCVVSKVKIWFCNNQRKTHNSVKFVCSFSLAVMSLVMLLPAQASEEVFYFYHGGGPMTEVYNENNEVVLQQAWLPTGERVQLNDVALTLMQQYKSGLPVRWTPRGIDLFGVSMQLTPSGLYSEELHRYSNQKVRALAP